jgi:xylan 1,4-beta-xylosidase
MIFMVAALHALQARPISFEWFEYSGQDTTSKPEAAAVEYRNPLFSGFYPDPSICRVGDDYYAINSSFAYYPGIPVFHSHDLVHWEQLGHVIDRPQQLPYDGLGVSRDIFGPAISYIHPRLKHGPLRWRKNGRRRAELISSVSFRYPQRC